MMVSIRSVSAATCALAVLAATTPVLAQPVAIRQSVAAGPRSGAYIPFGPVCDRAGVRECQAGARFKMSMCDPFPGRFVCADRILAEQSVCIAATGCD